MKATDRAVNYLGLGVRGLDSLERFFVALALPPELRDREASLDLVPLLDLPEWTRKGLEEVSRRELVGQLNSAAKSWQKKDELTARMDECASTYPSADRFWPTWTRLTLPLGMLSRRSAAATPGIRFAVENSGRCSRGRVGVELPRAPAIQLPDGVSDSAGVRCCCCCSVICSSCAIWLIFFWRALVRPLVRRCLAAMHRMW